MGEKIKQDKKYYRNYCLKNKERIKIRSKEYYLKNKKRILEKSHKNYENNKKRYFVYTKKWRKENPIRLRLNRKKNYQKRKEHFKQKAHKIYYKDLEKSRAYQRQWYWKNRDKRIQANQQYTRNHPRSHSHTYSPQLEIAMNNVRKRDKNTCQWYNCKLTYRNAPIHVHHIFPRSEYPELQYEEQDMICYCANHHELFHRYRGDKYSTFVTSGEKIWKRQP